MITKEAVEGVLRQVSDVGDTGDVVSAGRIERIAIEGEGVALTVCLPAGSDDERQRIEVAARAAVKSLSGVRGVMIMTKTERPADEGAQDGGRAPGPTRAGDAFEDQAPIEGVRNIIAVSSAKGGVGKSTVCVNLALAMAREGASVGLMDADVYGPSIHILLGTDARPQPGKKKEIAPVEVEGLRIMSLGLMTDPGEAVIWRGPMVMGVVSKFLKDVEWGDLDYLFVDMPPGTGDAQLTLAQTVPVTGAVIVTTASKLALVDAEKGLRMFHRVGIPVLGIVENMSYFMCPHCNERTEIFNHRSTREDAIRLGTRFLGELPLDPAVRAAGDEGKPTVLRAPDSPVGRSIIEIAAAIGELCPASGAAR